MGVDNWCMTNRFDFQKLEVYQKGLDFVVVADGIVGGLPKGRGYLADQLRRAAASIALNVAEGAGEFSPNEKARFYRIARRSATESAGLLDVLQRLTLTTQEVVDNGQGQLVQIVRMLTSLCRKLERNGAGQ
jgi:four helix bundle protein